MCKMRALYSARFSESVNAIDPQQVGALPMVLCLGRQLVEPDLRLGTIIHMSLRRRFVAVFDIIGVLGERGVAIV